MQKYENLVGLDEVKEAQNNVLQASCKNDLLNLASSAIDKKTPLVLPSSHTPGPHPLD